MKKIFYIYICFLITACSTTKEDFVEFSMQNRSKYTNGFCAFSIAQTWDGKFPQNMNGRQECASTLNEAMKASLNRCMVINSSSGCMVAYIFNAQENKIYSYETHQIQVAKENREKRDEDYKQQTIARENLAREKTASKCDSYGFTRGTNEFASCMLKIDLDDKQEQQLREAQYSQEQSLKKLQQQKALDSFNNSIQNINKSINPPSVTCNPNTNGGFKCK